MDGFLKYSALFRSHVNGKPLPPTICKERSSFGYFTGTRLQMELDRQLYLSLTCRQVAQVFFERTVFTGHVIFLSKTTSPQPSPKGEGVRPSLPRVFANTRSHPCQKAPLPFREGDGGKVIRKYSSSGLYLPGMLFSFSKPTSPQPSPKGEGAIPARRHPFPFGKGTGERSPCSSSGLYLPGMLFSF